MRKAGSVNDSSRVRLRSSPAQLLGCGDVGILETCQHPRYPHIGLRWSSSSSAVLVKMVSSNTPRLIHDGVASQSHEFRACRKRKSRGLAKWRHVSHDIDELSSHRHFPPLSGWQGFS